MKTKTLPLIAMALLVGTNASAQLQRIVLQGGGAPQVFTSITEAISAAQPNDKLYFSGGSFSAPGGILISTPLHFIGAGFHPDSANVTASTTWTTSGSTYITITTAASGSTFTGINFNPGSVVQYGTSIADDDPTAIVFQRCDFNKAVYLGAAEGASSSSTFDECIFRGGITGRAGIAVVTRCIFSGSGATINVFRPSGLFLKNSVVLGARLQNSENCIVQNCVFTYNGAPLWQVSGVRISNCLITGGGMFSNSSNSYESNNTYGQAANAIFVNETNGLYDFNDDLHLSPASPGVGGGNDGTDIGLYGTHSPYKPGGSPYNPHFQQAAIAPSTNWNGALPVQIRTAAQTH